MEASTVLRKIAVLYPFLFLALLLAHTRVNADAQPGLHQHDDQTPHGQADTPGPQHGESEPHGMHQHAKWVAPPPEYANKRSDRWADLDAIARGQRIYQHSCIICHGRDGRGTGPAAKALAHPPADLTHHFHRPPHHGDAYLFWRVSEGGAVEPFKSMQSAMPPFKTILSVDERWDVLAYEHAFFHLGLATWDATAQQQATQPQEKPALVTGEGTIVAVVSGNDQLVVKHGKIAGFMDAMTMGYKVHPPSLLEGLASGDHIRFTIDPANMAIVELKKLSE
jgi:mono/diheme cytochrome c family protein